MSHFLSSAIFYLAVFLFFPCLVNSAEIKFFNKIFPADAVINITLPPYNAVPDDGKDDTAAIQKAITDNVETGRSIYFPAGTYDVSDSLVTKNDKGHWVPHVTFQGQNRDKTILKLKNNTPGFTDSAKPKGVIMTGSMWNKGDAGDGGGNKAFRNNVFDLTVDTGSGNSGAIGIDYAVSNIGAIQNVLIKSGDGKGAAGISMRRKIPGPGLIKNVTIIGFDYGIDYSDIEYGMTLENVTLKDQNQAGIRLENNLLHIRKLASLNRVPAIIVTGASGVLTMVDSELSGGNPDNYAIDCIGNLMLRNVSIKGYRTKPVRWRGNDFNLVDSSQVKPELPGSKPAELKPLLKIEETPDFWNANLADWIAVGKRKEGEKDDTAAMQRALDSGKSTIYFPNNRLYFLSDTLVVRGKVKHVLGMGSEINLGSAKEPFSNIANPRPLIRIDRTDAEIVTFENMFFNAQYPGEVIFENNSPRTVVIRHCSGWIGTTGQRHSYRNTPKATGKLFVEDVFMPGWQFTGQQVWTRQFNPENNCGDGSYPQVENIGGKLWVLGFKTEGPAPFISTSAGGTTELLGAYNYISATDSPKVPAKSVPYEIKEATAGLAFTTENFRDNDYDFYIRQTEAGKVIEFKGPELCPRNGNKGDRSFVVPWYRSQENTKK